MSSALRNIAVAAIFSTMTFACARGKVITVNGIEVYDNYWKKAVDELGPRASFDLHCSQNQLSFTLFRKIGREPTEVGVVGCGTRAVYVRPNARVGGYMAVSDSWVMDTAAKEGEGQPSGMPAPSEESSDEMNL